MRKGCNVQPFSMSDAAVFLRPPAPAPSGSSTHPLLSSEPAADVEGRLYDPTLRHRMAQTSGHPDPLAGECVLTVLGAARYIECALEEVVARFGLSLPRYLVLLHLWRIDSHAAPLHEIAGWCNVTPRNVTGLVDGLEAAGLLRRGADPADRRVTLARLTDVGREVIEEAAAGVWERQSALVAGLSEAERRSLIHLCVGLARRRPAEAPQAAENAEGIHDQPLHDNRDGG